MARYCRYISDVLNLIIGISFCFDFLSGLKLVTRIFRFNKAGNVKAEVSGVAGDCLFLSLIACRQN